MDKIRGYEQRLISFTNRYNQTNGSSALLLLKALVEDIARDISNLVHSKEKIDLITRYNHLLQMIVQKIESANGPNININIANPNPPIHHPIHHPIRNPIQNPIPNTEKRNVSIQMELQKRKKIKTVQAKKDESNRPKKRKTGRKITDKEHEYLRLKRLKQFTNEDIEIDDAQIPKKLRPLTDDEKEMRMRNLMDPDVPSNMNIIHDSIFEAALPDPLIVTLRDHQKLVVRHMMKNRGTIAVHSVGSGKTLLAAVCARSVQIADPSMKIIFIAPKSLLTNFQNEIKRAYGDNTDLTNYMFYTYEKFMLDYSQGLIDCNNSFLIIDEAHKLRTHFKMANGVVMVPKTVETVMKCARKAKKVLLLTATPVVNDPYDIINLTTILDGGLRPILKKEFNKIYKNGVVLDQKRFNQFMGNKISIYVRPHDANYPTSDIHTVNIDMDEKYYKEYKRVEDIMLTEDQLHVFGPNDLEPFHNGIRRAVGADVEEYNPKLDWIKIFLERQRNMRDSTGKYRKTVIFAPFISLGIKQLEELVKDFDESERPKFGEITGKHSKKERQDVIDKYNNGKIQVLLISVGAGGLGINLFGTRDVIITTPGWNEVEFEQSVGRVIRYKSHTHLPENERHVDIWKLMMVKPKKYNNPNEKPSADYVVQAIADRKTSEIKKFMDMLDGMAIERN